MKENLDSIYAVIPVYNNAATVVDVITRTRKQLPHVLVVDDGSTDLDLVALYRDSDICVLRHSRNRGKGAAILTALEFLRNKPEIAYMITLDADGQHYPEDIPQFFPDMERNDYSLIVGCRDFSGANIPESSKFGRNFANFWMRIETGLRVDDCQSGFRAYPVRYISKLKFLSNHYNFEAEVLVRAAWGNLEIHNIPIRVFYPKREERISHFKPWLDNFRLSCIHFHLVGLRMLPYPKQKLRPSPKSPYSLFRPKELIRSLVLENATPAGLAASAGMSSFLAVLPIPGFHILAILYAAERLHLNKVMAWAVQNLYAPPFSPFLCIEVGYFMRHGSWLTEFTLKTALHELHFRIWEWFLGSLLLAPFWMIVSAAATWGIATLLTGRKKQNENT